MTSPRTLLKAWDMKPKKRMGQNFLVDPSTAESILNRAELTSRHVVLEIGAGLGALTIPLSKRVKKVFAVEKDSQLIGLLKTELLAGGISNCEVIEQNILDFDLQTVADSLADKLTVVGNLPYNISSQILIKLIQSRNSVERAILMFQKELAERISAPPGGRQYGRISAMLQYCAHIQPIAVLGKQHFHPAPKIASQVVAIEFYQDPVSPVKDERLLFRVIKAAFANRRKTLKNSLSAGGLGITAQMAQEALHMASIDPGRRAETLTPSEFAELTLTIDKFVTGNSNLS